jgi:signal transduction histidine kinase
VSDDVPVDEQARGLRRLLRRPSANCEAWLRGFWLWEIYYATGFVVVAVLMLGNDDPTTAERVGSLAALGAMSVWYVAVGRPIILSDRPEQAGRREIGFVGGLVALLLAALLFGAGNSYALFVTVPMVFMCLPLRAAVPVVVGMNLLPPLATWLHGGPMTLVGQMAQIAVVTSAFSVLLGTWISRVITESEERKELISQLEASRAEVSRLSHEAGVATERGRLAAEIHDTLAQGFTSLLTLVQAAESELDGDRDRVRGYLTLAARTARENLDEARALVVGLTSLSHGTGSLDEAVHRQVDRLVEATGIRTDYRVAGDLLEVPTAVEVLVLRTVQETMTNIRKHAVADDVTVTLRFTGTAVVLTITDDGVGFDVDAVRAADPKGPTGFGLRGMRNRAEQVGGDLEIDSTPGVGTTVRLEVPL